MISSLKCLQRLLIIITLTIFVIAGVEIGFRMYLKSTGKDVITVLSKEEVLKNAWFIPHPHLLYVFKPDYSFIMNAYKQSKFTTNQFGFRSTVEFDVQSVIKPPNTIRIATLGGSTTMGVNDDNEIWPYLIGKYLQNHIPDRKIEILNEGIMGYTSLDNLLDLSMRVIDYNPDICVIYLGVNDLIAKAPLKIYRTDDSHFRRTLQENLSYASFFPSWLLRSKSLRAILQAKGVPDSRDLIANTGAEVFWQSYSVSDAEKETIETAIRQTAIRNIKSMIGIIRGHNPNAMIILSSFFDLSNRKVLLDLNQDIEKLAEECHVHFTDVAKLMPRIQGMAYDYGHFTPEGDKRMAEFFTKTISEKLSSN